MIRYVAVLVVAGLALLGCGSEGEPGADAEPSRADRARAEAAADALVEELSPRLFSALEESGPLGAIEVCSKAAQEIARAQSGDGLEVRRVTSRPRNPANRANGWSGRQLRLWEREAMRGKTPKPVAAVAQESTPDYAGGRELWYLRPLLVAPPCLTCHGDPETMDPQLLARLAELYPEDEAVGYAVGDVRGAIWVRLGLEGQQELPWMPGHVPPRPGPPAPTSEPG
jgi:hypothetical protein